MVSVVGKGRNRILALAGNLLNKKKYHISFGSRFKGDLMFLAVDLLVVIPAPVPRIVGVVLARLVALVAVEIPVLVAVPPQDLVAQNKDKSQSM